MAKKRWIARALGTKRRRVGKRALGYTPKKHQHRTHRKYVRVVAKRRGALHRYFGISESKKIPTKTLRAEKRRLEVAIARGDRSQGFNGHRTLRRINLALTLRKFHRRYGKKKPFVSPRLQRLAGHGRR